jgi:UPF0042 nucleotide-binding protein
MSMNAASPTAPPDVVILTGLAGAGRTTAIRALEDMGWEALDNFPLALIPRVTEPVAGPDTHPLAIGVDTRTRGFSAEALIDAVEALRARPGGSTTLAFLDASDDALIARFAETRRRHPAAPEEDPATGIARERTMLVTLREKADLLIDTSSLTPHDLKALIGDHFAGRRSAGLTVSIQSFAFKRGAPRETDMVMDCRFLRNPHWDDTLRPLDGRDGAVARFVADDPLYEPFFTRLSEMVSLLLPAYRREGKAYFGIGLGCTGGRHRSVALAEALAARLRSEGWQVNLRHRELERPEAGRS